MENISNKRNASIDIFRLICAIMVVAIHTHPFTEINSELGFFFDKAISRIAVPFFFCTMGYYYVGSLLAGKNNFVSTIKRLLSIYVIWSVPYVLYNLVNYIRNGLSIATFVKETLIGFFITGSWEHFWFFPASVISVIIVTLFNKIKGLKILAFVSLPLFVIGVLGVHYYGLLKDIPYIGTFFSSIYFTPIRRIFFMGLPFFVSGYFVNTIVNNQYFEKTSTKKYLALNIVLGIICLIEVYISHILNLETGATLNFALYPLMITIMLTLLKDPFYKYQSISVIMRNIANFMYYSHPLFIITITLPLEKLFNIHIPSTLLFILIVGMTSSLCVLLMKIDNRFLKRFYS